MLLLGGSCAATENESNGDHNETMIDQDKALKIARKNAALVYRDLSVYEVTAKLKDDKWYIDYEFKDKNIDGGGPHYVISAITGEILSFRYEQ